MSINGITAVQARVRMREPLPVRHYGAEYCMIGMVRRRNLIVAAQWVPPVASLAAGSPVRPDTSLLGLGGCGKRERKYWQDAYKQGEGRQRDAS